MKKLNLIIFAFVLVLLMPRVAYSQSPTPSPSPTSMPTLTPSVVQVAPTSQVNSGISGLYIDIIVIREYLTYIGQKFTPDDLTDLNFIVKNTPVFVRQFALMSYFSGRMAACTGMDKAAAFMGADVVRLWTAFRVSPQGIFLCGSI